MKSLSDAEAKTISAWAYRRLTQNGEHVFPFKNSVALSKHGLKPWQKIKPKRVSGSKPSLSRIETLKRICVLKNIRKRAAKLADEILLRSAPADVRAFGLAQHLLGAITDAHELLLQLARPGSESNHYAIEALAAQGMGAAIGLENLERLNPDLVKQVARTWPFWPVVGSPHKDTRLEVEAMIKRLEVGRMAPENVLGKWTNRPAKDQPYRHILGGYAARMMEMLRTLNESALRSRLQIQIGLSNSPFGLKRGLTPDEIRQCIQKGWPEWIVKAACLPAFSNETAKDWFEVGWTALREASGGNVASVQELKPVGESRAKVWRDSTPAQQETQRERQIHDRLQETFVNRFKLNS